MIGGMELSEALATMRLAFTRERQAVESARCMVLGTLNGATYKSAAPVLGRLMDEFERLVAAEALIEATLVAAMKPRDAAPAEEVAPCAS